MMIDSIIKALGDAGVYGAARYAIQQNPLDGSQRDWLDPDFGL